MGCQAHAARWSPMKVFRRGVTGPRDERQQLRLRQQQRAQAHASPRREHAVGLPLRQAIGEPAARGRQAVARLS